MDTIRLRHAFATAGAIFAIVSVACAGEGKGEPFTMLSLDEAQKLVGQPDVLIIDANPQDVFRKNHLPGARWWRTAPLAQLLPAQKDTRLVFYCAAPS